MHLQPVFHERPHYARRRHIHKPTYNIRRHRQPYSQHRIFPGAAVPIHKKHCQRPDTTVNSRALRGKPVHIATNDIAHETAILTLATMLQPGPAIIASASWANGTGRCRNLQNAGISSIAMHSHMDRNALDAAWTKIENSQCKMICIESSLMLDNDLQQRFSSLGDRHVHCSHFVLCEADAASMWSSDRFNAMHAQSVSAAWHCLDGNAGHVNVIAFSRIMPDDVTADIVATISPRSAPGRNGNNSITPCMPTVAMCNSWWKE